MKPENISIEEIDLGDEKFRISPFFSLEAMVASVKRFGLLHPPLLVAREGRLVLVSGWKRIMACRELALPRVDAYILEEEDDLCVFLRALYENLAAREFNLLEKAEALARLERFGERRDSILKDHLHLLKIPPVPLFYDAFIRIAGLEREVKEFVYRKSMPFSSVRILAELDGADRKLVLPFLFPLGRNKQKEVLEDLLEISRGRGLSISEIFKSPEIQEVWNSERLPLLQKAERIRCLLREKRYPSLSSWNRSFEAFLKEVGWPRGISIRPSPFFEDDAVSVSFRFRNRKEFVDNLNRLRNVASREEFARRFG